MKYAWIERHAPQWPMATTCGMLGVSVSGFKAWRAGGKPRVDKRLSDQKLLSLIQAIHRQYRGAYGSPRVYWELRDRGYRVSKERVERLMREHGIRARHKRRWKASGIL